MKNIPIAPPAVPTVGRIVHVTLSAELAASINRDPAIRGNACIAGETYPLIIARVWSKEAYSDGLTINGQLVLDGVGTFWMTSVHHGEEPGRWHWPHIEHAAELSSEVSEIKAACHDPVAVLIESLQELLDRARAHETHLIQDRDGRIALQVNTDKQLKDVTTERDALKSTLDQLKAVAAAWDTVFGELRSPAAA